MRPHRCAGVDAVNWQHRRRVAALGPRIQPGVCPSDDIELVWSLAARAVFEGKGDRDAPFILNVATHNCPRSGWDGSLRSAS